MGIGYEIAHHLAEATSKQDAIGPTLETRYANIERHLRRHTNRTHCNGDEYEVKDSVYLHFQLEYETKEGRLKAKGNWGVRRGAAT